MSFRALFIDIETMPNTAYIWSPKARWVSPKHLLNTGYTACFAAKWLGRKKSDIMFHSVRDHGKAKSLAQHAWRLLDEADCVIHYNGSRFDIPTLNRDFIEHGLTPPSPYHEIDLFRVVKQRTRLYSYSLDEVAKWLGIGSKLPHKGMDLWRGCMEGDKGSWSTMEKYNKQDVHLLEALYLRLRPWIKNHPNLALWSELHDMVCPACGGGNLIRNGTRRTKTQMYRQYHCRDCGAFPRGRHTIVTRDQGHHVLTI